MADRVQGKVVIIVTGATSGCQLRANFLQALGEHALGRWSDFRIDQISSCSSLTGSFRSRWPVA